MSQTSPAVPPRPWAALPPGVTDRLRPIDPALGEEIVAAIRAGVPAYSLPMRGVFARLVRTGVDQGLHQFLDLVDHPDVARLPARDVYVELGRIECREGRSLEALLAAYRIGARVAWRRTAERARRNGLDADALAVLAESIFAYIDELSALSAEGFAQEQSEVAGEAERRRRALVRLVVADPPADRERMVAAARGANWVLPESLAVLVWSAASGERRPTLPQGTLAGEVEGRPCALVPDPGGPGRLAELRRGLGERRAALGSTASPEAAASSWRRAVAALRLVEERAVDGLVLADDHLPDLLLRADPSLGRDLAARRLAPLAQRTPAARARLTETLRAWLDHHGQVAAIAEHLHVHPQTVRYRVAQLREDFGPELDDPAVRFELALALRA